MINIYSSWDCPNLLSNLYHRKNLMLVSEQPLALSLQRAPVPATPTLPKAEAFQEAEASSFAIFPEKKTCYLYFYQRWTNKRSCIPHWTQTNPWLLLEFLQLNLICVLIILWSLFGFRCPGWLLSHNLWLCAVKDQPTAVAIMPHSSRSRTNIPNPPPPKFSLQKMQLDIPGAYDLSGRLRYLEK